MNYEHVVVLSMFFSYYHWLFFLFLLILERAVLQRQEDQKNQALAYCSSREELQHNLIVQMKSVTGAEEDVCGSTLESNGYDLKTSIEAFYIQRWELDSLCYTASGEKTPRMRFEDTTWIG